MCTFLILEVGRSLMKRVAWWVVVSLCPVLMFRSPLGAQTVNATLGGSVMDATGALLPGATLEATGIDTGVVTKTITNDAGAYQFPSLQAGNYRVSAELPGFQEFVYQRVTLDVGGQMRLNFTLAVA